MPDALYFRVSSDHQTTENQFEDVLKAASETGTDWRIVRQWLEQAIIEDKRANGTTVYRIDPLVATRLADEHRVYIEHASAKVGSAPRPMFERMKQDAREKKFDRLIVWKVPRLGRNMRDVIATVYELSDLGITVFPVKSPTGPISTMMGKLLWFIQAWYAEMENIERAEAIRAGHKRAKDKHVHIGRKPRIFDRNRIVCMRDAQKMSWGQISRACELPVTTVLRYYKDVKFPKKTEEPLP